MRVPIVNTPLVNIPEGQPHESARHSLNMGGILQQEAGAGAFSGGINTFAPIARGLADAADATQNVALRLLEERAWGNARDAYVKLNENMGAFLSGDSATNDPGLYGRQGRDALDSVTTAKAWFDKQTATAAKGMNKREAELFTEQATALRMSTMMSVARHEAAERSRWETTSLTTQIGIEYKNALDSFTDERQREAAIARGQTAEMELLRKQGKDDATINAAIGKSTSDTLAGIFARQVEAKNYDAARKVFDDPRMSEEDKRKTAGLFHKAGLEDMCAEARQDPAGVEKRIRAELGLKDGYDLVPSAVRPVSLPGPVRDLAVKEAEAQGVPADLVQAVIHQESRGRTDAVSSKGARGPMQLMPETAKELGVNPDDPAENIRGGVTYLKQMLDRYDGDQKLALMAYNWGSNNVDAYVKTGRGAKGQPVPAETGDYVAAILGTDTAQGLLEHGNIDLTKRPRVENADGSISTVRTISVNMDGQEALIPTVSDDGRILSDSDAVALYKETGKHFGKFDTPENATAYAKRLHEDQERMYVGTGPEGAGQGGGNANSGVRTADSDRERHLLATSEADLLTVLRVAQSSLVHQQRAAAYEAKQQAKADADRHYADLQGILAPMPLDEREAVGTTMIRDIQDPLMQERVEKQFKADLERDVTIQKAEDNVFSRKFRDWVAQNNLTPSQALAALPGMAKDSTLSQKGRDALEKELLGEKRVETPKNRAALDAVRRAIDKKEVTAVDQVEAFAFDYGLTDDQSKKATSYLNDGGNKGQLKQEQVDRILKGMNKGRGLDYIPGFYDAVEKALEPGKPLTDPMLRKIVANLIMDGERKGGGWGYGRDMSYAQALNNAHAADWLPDFKDAEEEEAIRKEFESRGVKAPSREAMRQHKKHDPKYMGLPVIKGN